MFSFYFSFCLSIGVSDYSVSSNTAGCSVITEAVIVLTAAVFTVKYLWRSSRLPSYLASGDNDSLAVFRLSILCFKSSPLMSSVLTLMENATGSSTQLTISVKG